MVHRDTTRAKGETRRTVIVFLDYKLVIRIIVEGESQLLSRLSSDKERYSPPVEVFFYVRDNAAAIPSKPLSEIFQAAFTRRNDGRIRRDISSAMKPPSREFRFHRRHRVSP